ncbi:hypothetical protein BV25DRAFT_1816823, partial [Artomyces pyxidatus]
VVDREGRVVVYLAGAPKGDASWPETVRQASMAMDDILEDPKTNFMAGEQLAAHTRGQYPTLNVGFTHGGGPEAPYLVDNKKPTKHEAFKRLTRNPAMARIAGFASSAFNMAAPRLFTRYRDVVASIQTEDGGLEKPFRNSVFPTATFNFGPRAVTYPHRDYQNVPYGWCAITALGNYNPKTGGHIYLWELGLVIEFPPGSTILIPSAIITHGNTPIQEGETRKSFTQYCAGALMRWHTYGFRTEATLRREDPELHKQLVRTTSQRVQDALGLFSLWREIPGEHMPSLRVDPERVNDVYFARLLAGQPSYLQSS